MSKTKEQLLEANRECVRNRRAIMRRLGLCGCGRTVKEGWRKKLGTKKPYKCCEKCIAKATARNHAVVAAAKGEQP